MKKYLEIGKIVAVFGVRGEVKVQPWADSPEFVASFDVLHWKSGDEVIIERARVQKNMVVMKISGIDTVEDAQKLRNRVLFMDREDIELEDGCYFVQDLIGLEVIDNQSGVRYGRIVDVSQTGANDVYHIENDDGKLLLVPAIPDVVNSTDLLSGVMKITPLAGLFD